MSLDPGLRPTSPTRATAFYSTALFLLVFIGSGLQRSFGLPGVVLMQVLLFGGTAFGFALAFEQRPLREIFRIRRLTLKGLLRALALGLLSWAFAQVLAAFLTVLIIRYGGEVPNAYPQLSNVPFIHALLAVGLIPAICEELAFRGYLLHGLGPLGRTAAILFSGLLFGAMHLTAIRVLPLALLGMIWATAVHRSGSILPGMIGHFLNNSIALILTFSLSGALPAVASPAAVPSSAALLFLFAGAAGLGLAVWALAQSFSPNDAVQSIETADPAPTSDGKGRQAQFLVSLLPLLPSVVIYAYAVTQELAAVFPGR